MSASAFGNYSVLVIEDETFTRMVLARMLGGLGFKAVHQAGDGEAGLAAVRAHAPDIVLCEQVERFLPRVPEDDFDLATVEAERLAALGVAA